MIRDINEYALPAAAEPTHVMTRIWEVHNYMFFEAAPKKRPTLERVYFAACRGEWVSRESFDTIEEAMNAASRFTTELPALSPASKQEAR